MSGPESADKPNVQADSGPAAGKSVTKESRDLSGLTLVQLRERLRQAQLRISDLEALSEEHDRVRGQLSLAQVRLNALLASSSEVSIIATDLNGVITVFNHGAERMLGYRAAEMLGRQTPTLIHLESEVTLRSFQLTRELGRRVTGFDALVESARSGGFDHREWTYVRKDGSSFPVDLMVTAVRDDQGEINGFLGVGVDISERRMAMAAMLEAAEELEHKVEERTEALVALNDSLKLQIADRKKAEATLGKSEEKYRTLVDNLSVGIYRNTLDDGSFIQANPALAEMFGYDSVEEFMRHPARDMYQNPADRDEFMGEIMKQGVAKEHELRLLKKDGTPFWASCSATAMFSRDGQVRWTDGVIEDITARKEAQEAFRAGEERYRRLVEESFDGIFIQKGSGIVFANQQLHKMLGYDPGELKGMEYWRVYAPEYQELTRSRAEARMRGQAVVSRYEVKCLRKDGATFDAEICAGVINIEGQAGVQVWVRDITERRQALRALAASEERFRSLSENAPDIIYTLDTDGAFTYVNPAWERIMGHRLDEVLGRFLVDFVLPEDAREYARVFKDIRDNKKTIYRRGRARHKNGSTRYLEMSGAPNVDSDGRVTGMVGTINDITEAIMAERALKASEARQKAALESSPDPMVIYNLDGEALFVNSAFSQVFGWQPAEILGGKIDFVPEDQKQTSLDTTNQVIAGGDCIAFETQRYTKDGQLVDVSISSARYSETGDSAGGIIVTLRDITDAKRAQNALRKSETSLARAQEMAHLGNWELDLASGEMFCSREVYNILGLKTSETAITLRRLLDSVHPDDRGHVEDALTKASDSSEPLRIEHRLVHSGGEDRVVLNLAEVEHDNSGYPCRLVGAMQDITERRRSEEQMLLLAQVFETTIEGILVTDAAGIIQMVNPAFAAITGYSIQEAVGQTPRILNSRRQDKLFYDDMWRRLLEDGHWQGEIWNRRKNGEAYPEWLTITSITDLHGRSTHYVGVFHDITEIKRSEEKITFQAYHDALTGLPNRLLFNDRLTMALAHAARTEQGLAVIFLDIDHFKNINDSLGHAVGDMLLQAVAKRLMHWSRKEDTVARIGGDEFIMLLQGTQDPDYAVFVAGRILDSLTEPFLVGEHDLYVSASIGITLYPLDGQDIEALVSNADLAMYRAKEDGRNNYKLFTPAMNARVVERMALEGSLRKALERREFLLHYQPKVDLKSGAMVGVEALVRWRKSDGELVPPDQFIPVAEDTGQIVGLGRWVMETACAQTKQWHSLGFEGFHVAVNLSPRQFRQKNLVEMVQGILNRSHLPASALELEVTENVVMYSVEEAIDTLRRLAAMGVKLSMDDFGRGYSSLYYLKRFPMHSLKIDRSFVADIATDPDDASIVNTIISMSRSLNLKVIAEGVETREQLDFLRENRCDQIQGYYFSRAVGKDEVTKMLQQGKTLV